MDDEEWIIEDPSTAEPEPVPVEEVPAEAAAAAEPELEPTSVHDGSKKLIFKHWVRPKFLQYTYMYDYRRNYYDDVIDYLDRRQKGITREPPRAQTWGERVLRTYVSKTNSVLAQSSCKDRSLLAHISSGARFHRYHSKSLITRKYTNLGFSTMTIQPTISI